MKSESAYSSEFSALVSRWALDPASKPETVEQLIGQCREIGVDLDLAEGTKKIEFVELAPTPPNTVRFIIPAKSDLDTEVFDQGSPSASMWDAMDGSIESLSKMPIGEYSSLKCGISDVIDDRPVESECSEVGDLPSHSEVATESIRSSLEELGRLEVGAYSSRKCGS